MKKINKFLFILSLLAFVITACAPDEFLLGDKDVAPSDLVEGIAFKIEHDASNPNIIYLKSMMGNKYTPLWNHPQGRSQEQVVTLKIPFAGTYSVQFGVETRGGIVYGEPVTLKVDQMYAGFISDEMWTLISGGSGKSKTWYLDLDASGVSKYFDGPLYFYGTYDSWEQVTNGVKAPEGADSWNWNPKYKENTWLMNAADFGSMTFDLIDGANLTVEHKTLSARGIEKGSYMMDVDNHTMRTTDASVLHDDGRDQQVLQWGDIRILSLTKDAMQLAVMRDNSSEGKCLLVYNFISKDYADSWTPGEVAEPEPKLPDGWEADISQTVSKTIKWVLSPETPFNWATLDGTLMNADWTSADKYASWTGFNASAAAKYANFSLTLNSATKSATYVAPDGTSSKGTYTLDEKGIYAFDGFKPNFEICGGWVYLSTTDANQWRITSIEKDASGAVTGMWVGKRDPQKAEYMVYHLVPQIGGGGATDKLAAWKTALVNKTFKPDANWFIDWLNFDMSGGWTSASTFGADFTSNGWVWNEATSKIAKSVTLKFTEEGAYILATLTQDVYDESGNLVTGGKNVTGKVVINPDNPSIGFEFPLVNYTGSAGNWLNATNPKGSKWTKPLGENEWIFVSHGESNLSNINSKGFWLGAVSNAVGAGDTKDELLVFHYVLAN